MRLNEKLILVLIIVLGMLTLYSLAGSSDRLDSLTAKERAEVVARW